MSTPLTVGPRHIRASVAYTGEALGVPQFMGVWHKDRKAVPFNGRAYPTREQAQKDAHAFITGGDGVLLRPILLLPELYPVPRTAGALNDLTVAIGCPWVAASNGYTYVEGGLYFRDRSYFVRVCEIDEWGRAVNPLPRATMETRDADAIADYWAGWLDTLAAPLYEGK